jgi:hypothetical protein
MKTDPRVFDVFFAELLLPLHHLNRRHDEHYFATEPDHSKASYWEPVTSRAAGGMERLRIGEGDGPALIARLTDYWTDCGETLIPQLRLDMETLWQTLMKSEEQVEEMSAEVSVTVYPLF